MQGSLPDNLRTDAFCRLKLPAVATFIAFETFCCRELQITLDDKRLPAAAHSPKNELLSLPTQSLPESNLRYEMLCPSSTYQSNLCTIPDSRRLEVREPLKKALESGGSGKLGYALISGQLILFRL